MRRDAAWVFVWHCGQRGVVPSTRGLRAVYSPATLRLRSCALRVRSVCAPCALRVRFCLHQGQFGLHQGCYLRFTSGPPAVYTRHQACLRGLLVHVGPRMNEISRKPAHNTVAEMASARQHLKTQPAIMEQRAVEGRCMWALAVIKRGRFSLRASCYHAPGLLSNAAPPPPAQTPRPAGAQVMRRSRARCWHSGAHAPRHANASTNTTARRRSVCVSLSLARMGRREVDARARSRVTRSPSATGRGIVLSARRDERGRRGIWHGSF